ncbi:MAG TPA: hypothetical protein VGO34_15720 [Alphaproteobacteria bacterium]|jgi:hypothetical protein
MTQTAIDRRAAPARVAMWAAILAATALIGSWAFACVLPFAAFATVAARTLRLRDALATMGVIWVANQIVGLMLLDYPTDANTLMWGVALGAAALLAVAVAHTVLHARALSIALPVWQRLPLAFVAAYAAYEALLIVVAQGLGGMETFTPAMVADVGLINVLWFAGLAVVAELLMGKGLLAVPAQNVSA